MKRFGWGTVVGVGVAGLLVAAPSVRATDDSSRKSSSSSSPSGGGLSGHDTAAGHDTGAKSSDAAGGHHGTMSGDKSSPSSDQTATGTGSASGGSEARGSGQAGTSTGARPGEVTGAGESGGTSEREAKVAAEGTHQLWGTVEKFDRESRTLSLEDSDKKLKVTDDTQIMKDGTRVSPGQIMEGDEVRASYSGSGDTEVVEVTAIEVVPAMPETGTGSSRSGSESPLPPGGSDKPSGSPSDASSGSTGTKSPQ